MMNIMLASTLLGSRLITFRLLPGSYLQHLVCARKHPQQRPLTRCNLHLHQPLRIACRILTATPQKQMTMKRMIAWVGHIAVTNTAARDEVGVQRLQLQLRNSPILAPLTTPQRSAARMTKRHCHSQVAHINLCPLRGGWRKVQLRPLADNPLWAYQLNVIAKERYRMLLLRRRTRPRALRSYGNCAEARRHLTCSETRYLRNSFQKTSEDVWKFSKAEYTMVMFG